MTAEPPGYQRVPGTAAGSRQRPVGGERRICGLRRWRWRDDLIQSAIVPKMGAKGEDKTELAGENRCF